MIRIRLITYIQNILIVVSAVVLYSCNSKPEFVLLGEAEGRAENFGSDIEVTTENIEQLYQKYDTYQLFDGEFYLIRSKQSYNNSRYLSRLIRMKEGKQVAAKTFYDCSIDICNVLEFGNKLLIGLNSLQNNYYNPTSHKAKVIILNKDLSPVIGSIFSSKKGHTYIQSLFVCSDNTFICSLESAEVIGNPYGQHQYRFRPDFSVVDSTFNVTWSSKYEIVREQIDFTKPDWGNDLSDEEIAIARNGNEAPKNDTLRDSTNIDANVSSQTKHENQEYPQIEKHSYVDLGLSVFWASCNVGACSPEEFGEYYAWGEISTKKEYTEDNYKWYGNKKRTEWGYQYQLTKYNLDSYYGRVDNKNKLDNEDDVAIVKWGNGWRMPTYKEWNELRKKCSWKWTCIGDVYGYRVTSSANNNSIFLPAAGEGGYQSKVGHYWASTISYADCANSVDFNENGKQLDYYAGWRQCGYSVRPVKIKDSVE